MAKEKIEGASKKAKGFIAEFKAFALKGNVMDMAVGVLIGSAFGGIVTSFTTSFINPLISLLGGAEVAGHTKIGSHLVDQLDADGNVIGKISEDVFLEWGDFITAIINFLIMAFCIFLMVKAVNKIMNIGKKEETPAAPTTKTCPYCLSEIKIAATKCAFCASDIPASEVE